MHFLILGCGEAGSMYVSGVEIKFCSKPLN